MYSLLVALLTNALLTSTVRYGGSGGGGGGGGDGGGGGGVGSGGGGRRPLLADIGRRGIHGGLGAVTSK